MIMRRSSFSCRECYLILDHMRVGSALFLLFFLFDLISEYVVILVSPIE